MSKRGTVNPLSPTAHGIPLWVVYGLDCFPQIVCATLRAYDSAHTLLQVGLAGPNVCLWGYSVYRRKPKFRTLGIDVIEWAARHGFCRFYDSQDDALADLRKLTTPKCGARAE